MTKKQSMERYIQWSTWTVRMAQVLLALEIPSSYKGFWQCLYATELASEDLRRLNEVTTSLYPEVGRYFGVSWHTVERNIRTASKAAWERQRGLLNKIAGRTLAARPTAVEFIGMLTTHVKSIL